MSHGAETGVRIDFGRVRCDFQRVIDAAIVEVIVDNPSRAVGHVNAVLGALECVLIRNRGGGRHLVVHVELAKDEEIVGMELADRLKHFVVHLRLVFKRFSHLPHRSDIEILHCHIRERDFFGWLVPDLHIGGNNVMLERRKHYAAVQRLRISSVAKMLIARREIVGRAKNWKISEPRHRLVRQSSLTRCRNYRPHSRPHRGRH